MSHTTRISLQVTNLDALAAAVAELGGVLERNCKTFNAYTPNQPCVHRITVPGVNYQIGVRMEPDKTYSLHLDHYTYGSQHDGNKLVEKFGSGLSMLRQHYAISAATLAARAKGWMVQRLKLPDGTLRLQCTGM